MEAKKNVQKACYILLIRNNGNLAVFDKNWNDFEPLKLYLWMSGIRESEYVPNHL